MSGKIYWKRHQENSWKIWKDLFEDIPEELSDGFLLQIMKEFLVTVYRTSWFFGGIYRVTFERISKTNFALNCRRTFRIPESLRIFRIVKKTLEKSRRNFLKNFQKKSLKDSRSSYCRNVQKNIWNNFQGNL